MRKLVFLSIYILTGSTMILFTLMNSEFTFNKILLYIVAFFFTIALGDHFKELEIRRVQDE